jgi:hypothetical protein
VHSLPASGMQLTQDQRRRGWQNRILWLFPGAVGEERGGSTIVWGEKELELPNILAYEKLWCLEVDQVRKQ